jgi:hypothetical protein
LVVGQRCWLVVCAFAGCGFAAADPSGGGRGDDDAGRPGTGAPDVDGPLPPNVACTVAIAQDKLEICLEDGMEGTERSAFKRAVTRVGGVQPDTRDLGGGTTAPAFQITASASELDVADAPDLGKDLTIALWVKVKPSSATTTIAMHSLVAKSTHYALILDTDRSFELVIDNQKVGDSFHPQTGGTVAADSWHHVAITLDAQQARYYVDGNVTDCDGVTSRAVAGTEPLVVGRPLADVLPLELDDVYVFTRRVSDEDVCALAGRTACATACPTGPPGPV